MHLPFIRTLVVSVFACLHAVPASAQTVNFFQPVDATGRVGYLAVNNSESSSVTVTLTARDDTGTAAPGGTVVLDLNPLQSRYLSSDDLENGASGITGAFGDGSGFWHIDVETTGTIVVQNFLYTPDGALNELSTSLTAESDGTYRVKFFTEPNASVFDTRLRLRNLSSSAGTVTVTAVASDGNDVSGMAAIDIPAASAVVISSADLASGNASLGVSGGLGQGDGFWNLTLDADVSIAAIAIALADGGQIADIGSGVNIAGLGALTACADFLPAFDNPDVTAQASCDGEVLEIYSETGLPPTLNVADNDEIMTGITGWIQRVPVPYVYNWRVPDAVKTGTITEASARGPIAVAIDGVPIFHYERRPDVSTALSNYTEENDTVLLGELDQCGGHSGQGDDYHYHYAPICLLDGHDLNLPIAFGLDGTPVYFGEGGDDYFGRGRYSDINNLPSGVLDDCNAILNSADEYEHYTTKAPPYVIGCHHGTFDSATQIEPRPMTNRSQGTASPFGGEFGELLTTVVTNFVQTGDGSYRLEFDSAMENGVTSAVLYTQDASDPSCWTFEYRTNVDEAGETQTACRSDYVAPQSVSSASFTHSHSHHHSHNHDH